MCVAIPQFKSLEEGRQWFIRNGWDDTTDELIRVFIVPEPEAPVVPIRKELPITPVREPVEV